MHVGHGRGAAYGATLGNLLEATGHALYREYYINDAGRQIDILAVSVYLRYLELARRNRAVPVERLSRRIHPARGAGAACETRRCAEAARRGHRAWRAARCARRRQGQAHRRAHREFAPRAGRAGIRFHRAVRARRDDGRHPQRSRRVRRAFRHAGIRSASSTSSGAIDAALDALRASGHVYTKDGAEWFKSTEFGDDEDRVVMRANGEKTYFASDIAYHFDKRQRGHDLLIDVWGADHHGYVSRVRGALMALGDARRLLRSHASCSW